MPNGQPGVSLTEFTADQEFQAGLVCDGMKATPTSGFSQCDVAGLKSTLLVLPAINTENADSHPARIAPRNLFDISLGEDNLFHFHADKYKIGAKLTAVNVTNKYALYNFLSTFSGTHYVSPRSLTGEVSLNF